MRIDFGSIPGVLPEITLKLTHSKKKARRIIRKMCGSSEEWDTLCDCDATTSPLQNAETGETVYLVWMTPCLEYGASTDAALLAHEAVHVAADYLQSLGMEDVDEEVMAYTVQAVSEYLIEEHFKWKKRHLDKH